MKKGSLKLGDVPPYPALLEAVKKAWSDVSRARYGARDLALAAAMVFTGCRIGEVVQLRRQDVDIKRKTVVIRQLKKRGEFQRVVPVPSNLYWEIMTYYLERTVEDRVFNVSVRQARNIVYSFTEKYLKKKIRPHAIRHSYAVAVLKATKNLEAVRRLLGHRDYTTIKIYLDLTQEDLEQELDRLFKEI
ncbi:MAG: site-specific integrase [Desulfurococcaceae archaeon]